MALITWWGQRPKLRLYEKLLPDHARQKEHSCGECFKGNFIGADFGLNTDLSERLPDKGYSEG